MTRNIHEIIKNKQHVPYILTASFIYYLRPQLPRIATDLDFDMACRDLRANWSGIQHQYKHLIDKDDLSTNSFFDMSEDDYPDEIKRLAMKISEELK